MRFVGYSEQVKAYKLIDPRTHEVEYSRSVVFRENQFNIAESDEIITKAPEFEGVKSQEVVKVSNLDVSPQLVLDDASDTWDDLDATHIDATGDADPTSDHEKVDKDEVFLEQEMQT